MQRYYLPENVLKSFQGPKLGVPGIRSLTGVERRPFSLHCIDVAAPGGGYICASSNSIPRGVKPENYRAMIETVEHYGRYAQSTEP
jgi:hypothetical protein